MKNINLIRDVAWTFARKTKLEFSDLFGEAALAYCQALDSWDTDRNVKLSNYAYTCMRNQLINYCKKETLVQQRNLTEEEHPDGFEFVAEESQNVVDIIVEQWEEDAAHVALMILRRPEMYEAATPNFRRWSVGPKKRLKKVKHDLQEQGWTPSKIDNAVSTIRQNISTL
jgi:RNA polymerase sigma factor (sigma-70 family)